MEILGILAFGTVYVGLAGAVNLTAEHFLSDAQATGDNSRRWKFIILGGTCIIAAIALGAILHGLYLSGADIQTLLGNSTHLFPRKNIPILISTVFIVFGILLTWGLSVSHFLNQRKTLQAASSA